MKHSMLCFWCIFMFGISAMLVSPNSLSDWEAQWCQVSVRISLICMVYGPNMTQLTKILAKTPKSHRQPAVARVVCHFASDANIILGKETTETTNAPLRGIGLVDWTVLQVQAASRMWRYPTWLLHSWLQADETKKCHFSSYITTNSNSNLCWVCTVQCSAYSSYLPPKETIKWSRPNNQNIGDSVIFHLQVALSKQTLMPSGHKRFSPARTGSSWQNTQWDIACTWRWDFLSPCGWGSDKS